MQMHERLVDEGTGSLSAFALLFWRLFDRTHRRKYLLASKPITSAHATAPASDFPWRTFASFALKDLLVQ
jgi:hypothetical protein